MAKKQQKRPSGFRKLVLYSIGGSVMGAILIYSFRGPNLAAETMSMQQKVLMEGKDFASSKEDIREIMQNIDLMPSKEIYKVRKRFGSLCWSVIQAVCGEISPTEYSRAGSVS